MLWLAAACFAALAGCGGPAECTVSGDVTLDGEPLPEGEITFVSEEHAGERHSAQIEDGRFSLEVAAGKNRVRISARKPVEGKSVEANPGQTGPEQATEETIPARYNRRTELTAEVDPDGTNELRFELQSGNK